MNNHTMYPPSIPVTCKGYTNDDGQTVFATGHEAIRFVYPQDKNTTRCAACQKAHNKGRSSASRERNLAKKEAERRAKAIAAFKAILANSELVAKLTPEQLAKAKAVVNGQF